MKVEDRVTGFKGVVASISFDLYGCVQAVVNSGVEKGGKLGEQGWFDVARLKVTSKDPVMERPDFDFDPDHGPAEKPLFQKP